MQQISTSKRNFVKKYKLCSVWSHTLAQIYKYIILYIYYIYIFLEYMPSSEKCNMYILLLLCIIKLLYVFV